MFNTPGSTSLGSFSDLIITNVVTLKDEYGRIWKRMWFVFAIQLISVLLIIQSDKSLSCDQADWSVSLDRPTWSKCPNSKTYLKGLWRNDRKLGDERVGRIEYGKCCTATEPSYTNQPATCSNANWLHTLDGWVIKNVKISDGETQVNIPGSKPEQQE